MRYRKEIDGLRAIAVLPVILFHAGFSGFSGGYIGVDVFFVISGYLITGIILEEQQKGCFSIINFYERRARRILPALSIVILFTTLMAYLLMPAYLLKSYSQSLVSVATFASNVFFYLTNGYFATASDEKPLLHTWSLAVEEQYYLFYPLFIVLFWSLGRHLLLGGIVLLAALSLALAHYLAVIAAVDANFYLIFSRAWELFFGSAIAFFPLHKLSIKPELRQFLSLLGLGLIIYSIVALNHQTPFPSLYTLLPVCGACLIVIFSDEKTYVGQILTHRLLVGVGLMSYSLYLWHQPLFAFLRLKSVGEPASLWFILAILATFLLAFLSWKYVESPLRNKKKYSKNFIFAYSAVTLCSMIIVGLVGHFNHGFKQRFTSSVYTSTMLPSPKRSCHTQGEHYLAPQDACRYFGSHNSWATLGDSHVVEPAFALAKKLEVYNQGLIHLSFKGCPPALLFEVKKTGCMNWLNESLKYLEQNKDVNNILLGFRHSYYLFGSQLDAYPKTPNIDFREKMVNLSAQSNPKHAREIYWRSYQAIISRLLKAGKDIYMLYPIPELPLDIHKAVKPFSVLGSQTQLDLKQSTSLAYYHKRHQFIINKLDSLPYGDNLHAIKPLEILCDKKYCPAVRDGKALYYDDNHLSVVGAELVARQIMTQLRTLALTNKTQGEPLSLANKSPE